MLKKRRKRQAVQTKNPKNILRRLFYKKNKKNGKIKKWKKMETWKNKKWKT